MLQLRQRPRQNSTASSIPSYRHCGRPVRPCRRREVSYITVDPVAFLRMSSDVTSSNLVESRCYRLRCRASWIREGRRRQHAHRIRDFLLQLTLLQLCHPFRRFPRGSYHRPLSCSTLSITVQGLTSCILTYNS